VATTSGSVAPLSTMRSRACGCSRTFIRSSGFACPRAILNRPWPKSKRGAARAPLGSYRRLFTVSCRLKLIPATTDSPLRQLTDSTMGPGGLRSGDHAQPFGGVARNLAIRSHQT
jgi:hypothetical protein